MYPTEEAKEWMERVRNEQANSSSRGTNRGSYYAFFDPWMDRFHIQPNYRRPLILLIGLILFLIIYRIFFGSPRYILQHFGIVCDLRLITKIIGNLPGDINYRSQTTFVYIP